MSEKHQLMVKEIDKSYRPIPFWSWNDVLDPDLLRWQIREMEKTGHGGFFMHARSGLQTEYLGKKWMECVGACIDEAQKTNMHAWLYDEDGWPSGFGAGKVTSLGDAYHGRWLVLAEYSSQKQADEADIKNLIGIYNYEDKVLVISHTSNPYYIDVMSKEAVSAFISSTHQRYYDEFPQYFDGTIKGFFTDEPRLSGNIEGDIPWSYAIPSTFLKKKGYDIVKHLPELFYPIDGYEKVRYDFYQVVNELFVSSYMEQIQSWCHEHNCKLTGHMMMEESIFTQMTGTGGVMPFYEYMDVPGIDSLRRMIASPIMPRQLSSVAHQIGISQTITESFALTGWNVRMEELKWIIDWQLVNGVNMLCQHLAGYTLRGVRKRDYPPSLFYQLPWWEKYHLLNDYVSRVGMMLSEGEYTADVLLLHPMRSGWVLYAGAQNDAIEKLDDDFTLATEILSALQIEYDLGDEGIIKKHGSVKPDGLYVGQAVYRMVVLPDMVTIDKNTVKLLLEFIDNGGRVVTLGSFPNHAGGEYYEKLEMLRDKVGKCPDGVNIKSWLKSELNAIEQLSCQLLDKNNDISISDIHSRGFVYNGMECRFFVNHHQESAFNVIIKMHGSGNLCEMDILSGEWLLLDDQEVDNGYISTVASFEPMQSRMYAIISDEQLKQLGVEKISKCDVEVLSISPNSEWDILEMDDNALTLDKCSYKIDDGLWKNEKAVIHIFDELLSLKRQCSISLKFNFDIACDISSISKEIFIAIERANEFEIMVNGQEIKYSPKGYWKDSTFLKVNIGDYIKEGTNEIILSRDFYQSEQVYHVLFDDDVYETELNKLTYDVELESIYLIGKFGVNSISKYSAGDREAYFTDGPFELVKQPTKTNGNMTVESMPFFAGTVKLGQTITVDKPENSKVKLCFNRPSAAISEVLVNGKRVKEMPWAPYEMDITDAVNQGDNLLEVILYSGNRNLLGPHHHINGEIYNVGPDSFTGKWSWVEKQSEKIPATNEERARNYWNDRYCMVRFGI